MSPLPGRNKYSPSDARVQQCAYRPLEFAARSGRGVYPVPRSEAVSGTVGSLHGACPPSLADSDHDTGRRDLRERRDGGGGDAGSWRKRPIAAVAGAGRGDRDLGVVVGGDEGGVGRGAAGLARLWTR